MRISTSYQYDTYSAQIASSQARYLAAQQQVATGKRMQRLSDDPTAMATALTLKSLKSTTEQYQRNVERAKGVLGFTENALGEANGFFRRAYELTLRAANGTTDQPSREGMAAEIVEIQRRLVEVANTRGPSGEYVFAGQANDVAPFSVTGTTLTYAGDAGNILVETGPVETLTINTQGNPLFANAYAELENLKNDLLGGNISSLSGVRIAAIQDTLNAFNQERGVVGTKLRTVEELTDRYTRMTDEFTKHISDVEDVDVDQAIMQYRLAETAYTAALQVASQGFRLSLMDFIRG